MKRTNPSCVNAAADHDIGAARLIVGPDRLRDAVQLFLFAIIFL